jgi:hypothetical protein
VRALVAAAVVAAAAPSLEAQPADAAGTSSRTVVLRDEVRVEPPRPIRAVKVDNRLGDVRVEGRDQPAITVIALKRGRDAETADRLKVSIITDDAAGALMINTSLAPGVEARPLAAGDVQLDLMIYVPRSARFEWNGSRGSIEAKNLDNGAALATHEGNIELQNCAGEVTSRAALGRQTFKEIFGTLDAQGIRGEMALARIDGRRLAARMHDGPIEARDVTVRDVTIRTTRGDVRFQGEVVAGGSYRISSYHGDVRVELRPGTSLKVVAFAQRGVDLPRQLRASRDARGRWIGGYDGGGRRPASLHLGSVQGVVDVRLGLADPDLAAD